MKAARKIGLVVAISKSPVEDVASGKSDTAFESAQGVYILF